jgi:hypothetical protein
LKSGYAQTTYKFDAVCGSSCSQDGTFLSAIEGIQQASTPQSKATSHRSSINDFHAKVSHEELPTDIVTSFLQGNSATIFAYG